MNAAQTEIGALLRQRHRLREPADRSSGQHRVSKRAENGVRLRSARRAPAGLKCYTCVGLRRKVMERETGFEPATNSLEGCDSTPELLPRTGTPTTVKKRMVEAGGFEPP
jgi:hypothetical protein